MLVLREVFKCPYDENAEAVGKSPAAVRHVAHRAPDHVAARRPQMPVSTTEQRPCNASSIRAGIWSDMAKVGPSRSL